MAVLSEGGGGWGGRRGGVVTGRTNLKSINFNNDEFNKHRSHQDKIEQLIKSSDSLSMQHSEFSEFVFTRI